MAHIVLLTTGGTIASRRAASGGSVASDSGAQLLAAVDGLDPAVSVEVHEVHRVNSFNITFGDVRAISEAVAAALARPEVDGVVITHGTDTLEETAALLDVVHDDLRPVVMTGAQRGRDIADSDGPRNLHDALRVASARSSRGRGVLVSFAGALFSALGIRKDNTLALQPFANTLGGPIGRIDEGRPQFEFSPRRQSPAPRPSASFDSQRIDVVMSYPGADSVLLDAALGAGARGLIVLGTGSGNPGKALSAGIARAVAADVVVALGTRTGSGSVLPIYGNGGAADALTAGAISLGALPATQGRVLLALLLSHVDAPTARRQLAELVGTHE
ncbi:MAG: asparaginase [Beutenbergiaceae bacterium]